MKNIISYILIVVFMDSVFLLTAQNPAWERINPLPSESSINDLALLPNDRIVAVGTGATIMITDDFGETWNIQCQPANVDYETYFTSVYFIDKYTGYITGSHFTLLKTSDGGESWTQVSGGAVNHYFRYNKITFLDDSMGFLSGNYWGDFLLKTSNGGSSWDTVLYPDQLDFSGFQFINQDTGYLTKAGIDYCFKSIDGGYTWDTLYVDPSIENLEACTFNFLNKDIAYIGGWRNEGSYRTHIILKTKNGGESWYEVFNGPSLIIQNIFFMNDDIGLCIGAFPWYTNSLLRTDNAGETWQIIDTLGFWFLEDICMDQNGTGLLTGRFGQIYKSIDYGFNWIIKSSNFITNEKVLNAQIISDSTIIAVTTGGTGGVPDGAIIRSNDAGLTWSKPEIWGLSEPRSISFVNDMLGFLCGAHFGFEYYKTVDGGLTWQQYYDENNRMGPSSICFIDEQTGFIGGYNDDTWNEIYKTIDGGETWNLIESEVMGFISGIFDIEFKDDLIGYIAGDMSAGGSIIKTEDCGETWYIESIPFENFWTNGVYFYNDNLGFIYGYNQIIITTDGGQTWDTTMVNLPGNRSYNFVHFPTPDIGYATGDNIVFKSTDGGNTWDPLEPIGGSQLNTVNFFTEDMGVAMGDNGVIFRTTTGGTVGKPELSEFSENNNHWKCYPNPFKNHITFYSEKNDVIISGTKIYGLTGKLVYDRKLPAGSKSFTWKTINNKEIIPNGIYLCEIFSGNSKETLKIIKM